MHYFGQISLFGQKGMVYKMADLKLKLIKSTIGGTKPQLATAHSLGLKKIGDVTVQPDNAATRGKMRKLAHLIQVSEVDEGGASK